jgi:RNA polymerase sigma factor (sigma-70 family)
MFTTRNLDRLFHYSPTVATLTRDEEARLLTAARDGDADAFGRIAQAYAPMLRRLAAAFRPTLRDEDNLRQTVLVGLWNAVSDPSVGRLSSRVGDEVRRALIDEAQAIRAGIKVPNATWRRYLSIVSEADGNLDEAEQVAPLYHMSREVFRAIREASAVDSVERLADNVEHGAWEAGARSPYSRRERLSSEERDLVRKAFHAVDGVERSVVGLAYGFDTDDDEPLPDAEIARRLSLHRSSVYKIRQRALDKMRHALGA